MEVNLMDEGEVWFNRGCDELIAGNYEAALASFDNALQFQPDFHLAWNNRGSALLMLGRFEQAIASYDNALQFKPDKHEAWYNRGNALRILGRYEQAIASYDKALQFQPDDQDAWYSRGVAFYKLGRFEEALASYDNVLQFQPDYREVWHNRGVVLADLGRHKEALSSYDQALAIEPKYHIIWYNRGNTLRELGRYEEELSSYDEALTLQPNFHHAWNNRGNTLHKLGRHEEALACFDYALVLQPNYQNAWYSRAVVLNELKRYEEALACFDHALALQPNYQAAWNGRGNLLWNLGRLKEAISSFDRALQLTDYQDWMAWANRGGAVFSLYGYDAEVQNYSEGLQSFQPENPEYQKGCGVLHRHEGTAHYYRGRRDSNPRPYWHKAVKSYKEALKTLTASAFPERHLEVLQDLLRVYSDLGETQKVQVLLAEGTDLLWRLLQETPSDGYKIQLARKFASFTQLRVDELTQSGNWCAALELAEQRKNLCLTWLHNRWSESVDSPNYAQMQELLKPSPQVPLNVQLSRGQDGQVQIILPKVKRQSVGAKAIVYWHISPAAITTFILRYNQPPIILSAMEDLTPPAPLPSQGRGEKDSALFAEQDLCIASTPCVRTGQPQGDCPYRWRSCVSPTEDELGERSNYSPLLAGEGLGERFFYPPSLHQLIDFENWIETWKKDYQKYRQGTRQQNEETRRDAQETPVSSAEQDNWRDEMPKRLEKLVEILNIEGIFPHLKGVSQLILIPHRDLHLLPLHALFNLHSSSMGEGQEVRNNFTITYLPSIKVGLDRKTPKPNTSLLSVENPTNDLRFAPLESDLICQLYPTNQRLTKSAATKIAVKTALSQRFGMFHFAGHSEHNLDQPAQSALILANKEQLTLKDILELDLSHYNLVGLSGCETNFTSKVGLIEEFVGLASGFVAAGANNVVGSLWNVSDRATAYFMRKFHEILIASDTDVPSALKQAQHLLRNVTNKELEDWETTLPSPLNQERSLRMPVQARDGETDDDAKPFESPYYWAAFCAIGL
jgi:tetratricopeptide (TPR) repeat protein